MNHEQRMTYMAGFFDGEGCISICEIFNHGKKYHRLSISVSQNERSVLDMFCETFGVAVYDQRCKSWANTGYQWMLWRKSQQKVFLEALAQFLICKKKEAEIGLAFIETHRTHRWHHSEEENRTRAELRNSLMLKAREIKAGRTLVGVLKSSSDNQS